MKVYLTRRKAITVADYAEASEMVRNFIEANDLGAGCGSGPAFTGGSIVDDAGKVIARVSYNGRIWENEA